MDTVVSLSTKAIIKYNFTIHFQLYESAEKACNTINKLATYTCQQTHEIVVKPPPT